MDQADEAGEGDRGPDTKPLDEQTADTPDTLEALAARVAQVVVEEIALLHAEERMGSSSQADAVTPVDPGEPDPRAEDTPLPRDGSTDTQRDPPADAHSGENSVAPPHALIDTESIDRLEDGRTRQHGQAKKLALASGALGVLSLLRRRRKRHRHN